VKTIFNFIFCCAALLGGVAYAEGDLRGRLAGLCDYVAADYPGAVKDGKVVAQDEYAEQQAMLAEARRMAGTLAPLPGRDAARATLTREVARLAELFDAKAAESELAAQSRKVRQLLIDDYGLRLQPPATPARERALQTYQVACASCHGEDGKAQTRKAQELKPPPVSFFDEERMSRVSPALAFHAISFGIAGTGMAAFDTLPASDRWSLAFHVIALRHAEKDGARGQALYEKAQSAVAPNAAALAPLSDRELDAALKAGLPDASERALAIAWLRTGASFRPAGGGTFDQARRLLDEVAAVAEKRDQARARAIAAYLEGVEPHEAALRTRDRAATDRIERSFGALRAAIEAGKPAEEIRAEVARVKLVLDDAERGGKKSVPFLAALAIALREGFELSLLLAALLAFLRKSGKSELARYVHLGWLAAVPAGAITWFLIGAALGGARRELTEGILTLVAAGMLLFVSHFVLGRMESRKWLKFLERKTTSAAGRSGGVPWPLVAVAFVAAYREAIEIVLFFRALVLDAPGGGLAIAAGAATGIVLLVALVKGVQALGKRLNPRPVMLVSSILLTAIAISLVGQGVRALQEGGYLPVWPVSPHVRLPVLGVFPTVQGLAAQLVVLLLVVVPAWLQKRKARVAQTAS
jgi:high-affinity iron transporter